MPNQSAPAGPRSDTSSAGKDSTMTTTTDLDIETARPHLEEAAAQAVSAPGVRS